MVEESLGYHFIKEKSRFKPTFYVERILNLLGTTLFMVFMINLQNVDLVCSKIITNDSYIIIGIGF